MGRGHKKLANGVGSRETPPSDPNIEATDIYTRLLGFTWVDLSSVERVMRLLYRPTDPAGLGIMRVIFGMYVL